jgi:hypothetical protein
VITVETTSRWATSSLLRKLRGHDVYAVQIGAAHWLVRSSQPVDGAGVAAVRELVEQWARDEGMPLPTLHVGDSAGLIAQ